MAFTYDLSTDTGKVRLLVPDRNSSEPVFQDNEISTFLDLEGGSIHRAAALALETVATDEALVLKVAKLLDTETDGAKLAETLLKRAASLRKQADGQDARSGDLFDWAEMSFSPFAYRERLANEWMRSGS